MSSEIQLPEMWNTSVEIFTSGSVPTLVIELAKLFDYG